MICSQATRASKNTRLHRIAMQSKAKRNGVKFAAGLKDLFFTLAPGLFNNALI
jgi:hypothetical protein